MHFLLSSDRIEFTETASDPESGPSMAESKTLGSNRSGGDLHCSPFRARNLPLAQLPSGPHWLWRVSGFESATRNGADNTDASPKSRFC